MTDFGVLFVCTGNICRSPTAEGVFRHLLRDAGLAERVMTDSAGLIDYHVGHPADPRSVATAARRGYDLCDLRARKVESRDFQRFDLLLAMDHGHRRQLEAMAPRARRDRVRMFLEFASATDRRLLEVPDPYFGAGQGFEEVLDLVEDASRGLLDEIRRRLR